MEERYSEVSHILEQSSGVDHLEMVSELFPGRIIDWTKKKNQKTNRLLIHETIQLYSNKTCKTIGFWRYHNVILWL